MNTTLVHLSTILLLLLQNITTIYAASCSSSIAYTCNTRGISATQRLTLTVTNHDNTNYDATVIFHWQGIDNNLGSKTYVTEQGVEVGDAHTFGEHGTYYFGYTVQYGDEVGCADRTRYYVASYPSSSEDCSFDNYEGSNVPTRMISDAPSTLKPTNEIVTPPPLNLQPNPTPRPTIKWDFSPPPLLPFPDVPTDNTKPVPTPSITTTPVPTIDESQTGGTEKTLSPTNNNVRDTNSPTTPAPIIDVTITIPPPNTQPTLSPTIKPISSEYNQTIRSTMVLLYSDLLDDVSNIIWTNVTEQWITNEVVELTGIEEGMVHVDVDIIQQNLVNPGKNEEQNNIRRKLQSSTDPLTDSLDIQFQTTIVFPQSGTYEYDINTLVSSGFDTVDERQEYIKKLQEAGAPDYFTDVNNMLLSVDGTFVQAKPNESTEPPPVDPTDPGNAVDNGTEGEKNSVVPIVAGVVGGVLLIVLIIIGVYYNKRRNQQQEGKDSHTTQDSSGINNKTTVPAGSQGEVESTQPSPGENETGAISLPEAESYFGTIEATRDRDGFDDVSTLGDPYMGDAVAVVDADNTVGESTVRSEQQEYYGAGGKRIPTGIDSIMSSRFGGSTIGSNRMMFSDDPTLEDIYDTPEGNKTEEDASFERISVEAPAGMLGIVLDNPRMDLPIVYAIKETSALHGKVRVGDLLLNVDEIDCRGMSAHQISTFLSSRSKNPTRRLILARGTGSGTTAI